MEIEGKVWKFGDNISTDLMMPGDSVLQSVDGDDKGASLHCMQANRPGWSSQIKKGDIIVAGTNFGCGSSRPAPRLLSSLGIGAVLADSMSRLFFRNAVNIGFPVIICKGVTEVFQEGDMARIDFETGLISNLTSGKTIEGEALPSDSPPMQILKAGGLYPYWKKTAQKA